MNMSTLVIQMTTVRIKKGQSIECIKADDKQFITKGSFYTVISFDKWYVKIHDDRKKKGEYHKERFKTNKTK